MLLENVGIAKKSGRDLKTSSLLIQKKVTYIVESTLAETRELLVANVLWKNALLVSEQRVWMHRMSFVLLFASGNWEILLAQVTPVQVS